MPSLRPSDPMVFYNMTSFVDRHAQIVKAFSTLIITKDNSTKSKQAEQVFDLLRWVDEDLRKIDGPYLCGNYFSLADVNIFPFVERIHEIFTIPDSLLPLLRWYDIVSKRRSVEIVSGSRIKDEKMKWHLRIPG
jgi:glutathione S-transferase